MNNPFYRPFITMEDVRADCLKAEKSGNDVWIFYGVNTRWWTHRSEDLYVSRTRIDRHGLPCDPRGGMLYQFGNWRQFTDAEQIMKYDVFGPEDIRVEVFMAAHHMNCYLDTDLDRHWCVPEWSSYVAAVLVYLRNKQKDIYI